MYHPLSKSHFYFVTTNQKIMKSFLIRTWKKKSTVNYDEQKFIWKFNLVCLINCIQRKTFKLVSKYKNKCQNIEFKGCKCKTNYRTYISSKDIFSDVHDIVAGLIREKFLKRDWSNHKRLTETRGLVVNECSTSGNKIRMII